MYAVIAPGFECIYTSWKDVERIKALYPYPKFCKCNSEDEALEWIRRNKYARKLDSIYNYGNTFSDFYADVKYKIGDNCVYYVINTSRIGHLRINSPDTLVEYKGNKIYVKCLNIKVSNETLAGHLSAIYNLLGIVGPYIDINLELEHYALYYALTVYSKGKSRPVNIVRKALAERLGATAISLKFINEEVN